MGSRDPQLVVRVEPRRLLECIICGQVVECSAEELLRYTREGWPRCCGQVMVFSVESISATPTANPQHETFLRHHNGKGF
jgi:hypothetical protein